MIGMETRCYIEGVIDDVNFTDYVDYHIKEHKLHFRGTPVHKFNVKIGTGEKGQSELMRNVDIIALPKMRHMGMISAYSHDVRTGIDHYKQIKKGWEERIDMYKVDGGMWIGIDLATWNMRTTYHEHLKEGFEKYGRILNYSDGYSRR